MHLFENKINSRTEKEEALDALAQAEAGPALYDMGRGVRFTDDTHVKAGLDTGQLIPSLSGASPGGPILNKILKAQDDPKQVQVIIERIESEKSRVYACLKQVFKAGDMSVLKKMPSRISLKEELNLADLYDQIQSVREEHPHRIIGLNLMHAVPDSKNLLELAGKTTIDTESGERVRGVDIVFVGAGIPKDLPKEMENYPALEYVPIVSNARVVKIMMRAAKGKRPPFAFYLEHPRFAGGHLGGKGNEEESFEELLDVIKKEAPETPIIVGGGIAYNEDIVSVLDNGKNSADGVGLGTRLLLTQESGMSDELIRSMYLNEEIPIEVTRNSPTGLPSRSLKTAEFKVVAQDAELQKWCRANCISCIGHDHLCQFFQRKNQDSYCIAEMLTRGLRGADPEKAKSALCFTGSRLEDMRKDGLYRNKEGKMYVPTVQEAVDWILDPKNRPQ